MALVTDYTNSGYNGYATVAEVDAIIALLAPFTDTAKWTASSTAQKEGIIQTVSQDVNCFEYFGALNSAVVSPFNMMFPRTGMTYTNGTAIPSTVIPQFVKDYVARRCLEVFVFGPNQSNNIKIPNNVKRVKVDGVVEREYFAPDTVRDNPLSLDDFDSYDCTIKPYVNRAAMSNDNTIYLLRA